MVGKQLKNEKYVKVAEDLMKNARNRPLSPIYEVDINFNGERYMLFLQSGKHRKIYALYAIHYIYEKDVCGAAHELITDNVILSSLMEMIIYQGIK